jgi:hypothetical protein
VGGRACDCMCVCVRVSLRAACAHAPGAPATLVALAPSLQRARRPPGSAQRPRSSSRPACEGQGGTCTGGVCVRVLPEAGVVQARVAGGGARGAAAPISSGPATNLCVGSNTRELRHVAFPRVTPSSRCGTIETSRPSELTYEKQRARLRRKAPRLTCIAHTRAREREDISSIGWKAADTRT